MGKKTPPCEVYPQWTTARFWSFLRSALRQCWTRWPPRYETLNDAKRPYKGADKRRKFEYQCCQCKKWYKQKEVEVDHIVPCGTLKDWKDIEGFVKRLLVSKEGLRVVCKPCHLSLTAKEKEKEI